MALDPKADAMKALDPSVLPDDVLASRLDKMNRLLVQLQKLLRERHLTPDHVILVLHSLVKHGVLSEEGSGHLFNGFAKTSDGIR